MFILRIHKHSDLILHQFLLFCDFLRKCWNPRWRIQDGGSNDVTWRHATSQPIKIMPSCRVSYGLSCESKIISLRLNITKTPGRGSIHPPLYDGGGMSLLVRPRVNKFINGYSIISRINWSMLLNRLSCFSFFSSLSLTQAFEFAPKNCLFNALTRWLCHMLC